MKLFKGQINSNIHSEEYKKYEKRRLDTKFEKRLLNRTFNSASEIDAPFICLGKSNGAEREIRTPVENPPPVFKTGAVGQT